MYTSAMFFAGYSSIYGTFTVLLFIVSNAPVEFYLDKTCRVLLTLGMYQLHQ